MPMSRTATLPKPRAFYASDAERTTSTGLPIEAQSDGTSVVRGMPIFRAGTFRDSWGELHTWEPEHLVQMVDHFTLLRARNIFPNVPVRADHSISVRSVMGYIEDLTVDAENKLLADVHFTEPEEADKVARGTYRSVSSEVGMYETNDQTSYWPVLFGFAYVDMPAVEGLHNQSDQKIAFFAKENQVPTGQNSTVGASPPAATNDPPTPTPPPDPPTQPSNPPTPASPPSTPDPAPTPPPTGASTFRVNGATTSDFGAVQRHIDALEGVVRQNRDDARKTFVSSLATANKILAPQVAPMQEMVAGMTDEQYKQFESAYATTTPLPILQEHGGGNPNPDGDPNAADDEKAVCEEQIAIFRRQHRTDEQIQNSKAYKRLQELKSQN